MSNIKVALQKTFLCITAALAIASCSLLDIFDVYSWPKEPKGGVMFLDGDEYRETGLRYMGSSRSWYLRHDIIDEGHEDYSLCHESNDYYLLKYNAYHMVNKERKRLVPSFSVTIPSNIFMSRDVFSSEDKDLSDIVWHVSFWPSEWDSDLKDIEYIKLKVINIEEVKSSRETFIYKEWYAGRFEYEMIVLNEFGEKHSVIGWAEYLEQ